MRPRGVPPDRPQLFELALRLLGAPGRVRSISNGAILESNSGRTIVTVYFGGLDAGNILELAFGVEELARVAGMDEPAVLAWLRQAQETLGRPAKPKFKQQWPRVGVSDETGLRALSESFVALLAREEASSGALNRQFALVTLDGDVVYPFKKCERSTGRYGFALSAPGERDADPQAEYTVAIEDVVRRVVLDGYKVRVRSERNPARRSGSSIGLDGRTANHYWIAPELRFLVQRAAIPPLLVLPDELAAPSAREDLGAGRERALAAIRSVTAERYADVLAELDAALTPAQREMLVGHARAPGCTLSMQRLAQLGGYADYSTANLQYGLLGGKVAEALRIAGLENQVQALCNLAPANDEAGHAQWTLRASVFEAMRDLELIPTYPPADDPAVISPDSEEASIGDRPPTTRQALTLARLGQGAYRRKMLRWWGGCAVTGCTVPEAIVASHSIPWKDASDEQRLDHWNGLPLVGTLDRLFDSGLISFSDTGELLVSARLNADDLERLGVRAGLRLRLTHPQLLPYLGEHRRRNGFQAD